MGIRGASWQDFVSKNKHMFDIIGPARYVFGICTLPWAMASLAHDRERHHVPHSPRLRAFQNRDRRR